jgi:hypothetical protein
MPNITPTQRQAGARSFSATVTTASSSDTVQNSDLVALTTGGTLQTALEQSYASAAAFVTAFAEQGGTVFVAGEATGGGGGGVTPIAPVAPPASWTATYNVPLGGDIQTAINAAAPGDRILLAAGTYTVPGALTINKALTLQGAGQAATVVQTAAAAGDPVVLLTISFSDVVVRDLTLKQRKTTNTSIEAAVAITAGTGSSGHFLEAVTVESMEFGVTIKSDGWQINNCLLAYVGPNNSTRRLIGIYRSAGQGLFTNSTYNSGQDGVITGNTRVVAVTTGAAPPDEVLGGYLRLGNITPSNGFPVQQFFNCDYFAPSGTPLSFVVDGCTSAETSAFIVFAEAVTQPPLAQCALIALQGNTLTNVHGKGAIALNGGAGGPVAPGTTTFYATGNTLAATAFIGTFVTALAGSADPAVLAQMGYDTLRWTNPSQTITGGGGPVPVTSGWTVDGGGKPVLTVASGGAGAQAAINVALAWSASR